ncbi:hypothetical protein [Schinkia azotoformans]|uniref:hypothetical protein n=1 Tax=Schinkia azotoformans TaxID=1454 RepID=UPI002DBE1CE1|nr:hypothetical protein [Schinkia azotoformans]MEC1771898.1 hypothetical protein [Schinkia azotoformans]MED4366396.1 hypothetical protein [Schinkia azotoformans]
MSQYLRYLICKYLIWDKILKNTFIEGELERDAVVANFATTAAMVKVVKIRCFDFGKC